MISLKKLRAMGFGDDDISLAIVTQDAQRRTGAYVQRLDVILTGKAPREVIPVTELTPRQLRRKGRYGQAALLLDQGALDEADPHRAQLAREAAMIAKNLGRSKQLEFDFFGGNYMSADAYHDAIRDRLVATKATTAERCTALAILQEIKRHLGWQSFTCSRTAAEIGDLLKICKQDMSDSLSLLEKIGAITRVKRGRTKTITVTPEGAFRGNVNAHAEVVDRYKAEVLPFRPRL